LSPRFKGTFYGAGSPGESGDERGNTDTSNSSTMNSKKAVAAPATVSGEPKAQHGHWETGKAGPKRLRPASQETCQHGHPTGGRGVHTERSFAAVTAMPVRGP